MTTTPAILLGVLLAVISPAVGAWAVEVSQPATQADLESALNEIDSKAAAITDVSARFEQTKKTAMLRRPLVSSGAVKVKGAVVRWDTEKPHQTAMRIDESQIRVYYPQQATLEVFDIDESMRKITASPLPRLALIREQFSISPADVKDLGVSQGAERYLGISLVPRQESLRKHVERVRVLIERASGCAANVEITDTDGDITTIAFTDIKTNLGLTDSDLALTVPEKTRIVKPLEGLHAAPGSTGAGGKTGGGP